MEQEYPHSKISFVPSCIYGLVDQDDKVFYVGMCTTKLSYRLVCHMGEAKYWNDIHNKWVITSPKCQRMRELDFKVFIKPLEDFIIVFSGGVYTNQHILQNKEKQWISKLALSGLDLTNVTNNPLNKKRASVATA